MWEGRDSIEEGIISVELIWQAIFSHMMCSCAACPLLRHCPIGLFAIWDGLTNITWTMAGWWLRTALI